MGDGLLGTSAAKRGPTMTDEQFRKIEKWLERITPLLAGTLGVLLVVGWHLMGRWPF